MQEIDSEYYWMTPIASYLRDDVLPNDKEAARKLKVQATRFILIKDVLYKRGFSQPYLRCLIPKEADYVMREVHKEVCEDHFGSWSLVHKLIRAGYYWPTIQRDAQAYVKACDKCQRFDNLIRQPTEELTPMIALWLFVKWGLDIIGPVPNGGQVFKVLSSWYRLLHQVGRSKSLGHNHKEKCAKFCMEKQHL